MHHLTALILISSTVIATIKADEARFTTTRINNTTQRVELTLSFGEQRVYKDSLLFTVDHPHVRLGEWKAGRESMSVYDPGYRSHVKVYESPLTLVLDITKTASAAVQGVHVHAWYQKTDDQAPREIIIPVPFEQGNTTALTNDPLQSDTPQTNTIAPSKKESVTVATSFPTKIAASWSAHISQLIETSQSLWIRLLLVLLLGILLSLTPCIYPMIPITVGILQAHSSTSFWYNCLLALAYTCGLAMTYALLGLFASCVGPLCGKLLMHPLFVILLVALLLYLAGSLFDWYELYTPSFLKPRGNAVSSGSVLSSFAFGVASGTFASPCISPGLALLLTIVAHMGSALRGFLLLFTFGIGLSVPLLIVGTISGSMNLLPRAGAWMVQIKRIFGFMMIGMCFYYLKNIMPWHLLLGLLGVYCLSVGLYYLYNALSIHRPGFRKMHQFFGSVLIMWAVVSIFQSVQYGLYNVASPVDASWYTDLEAAKAKAISEKKRLFLDFWASYCSICHAINNGPLKKPAVLQALQEHTVKVSVDGTYESNLPFAELRQHYAVSGFPTFLLVDPATGTILKRWGPELYTEPAEQFIAELKTHAPL